MMEKPRTNYGSPTSSVAYYVEPWKWYKKRIHLGRTAIDTCKQVQMSIEAHFVSDVLRGNDVTEMRVTLIRYIEDEMPPDDE